MSNNLEWEGIVKVQRPLASNLHVALMLVYNKDRTINTQVPLTKEWTDRFNLVGKDKLYCYAKLKKGDLKIGDIAPNQTW